MPPIRSLNSITDGFTIESSLTDIGNFQFSKLDIPANINNQKIDIIEGWVNNWLDSRVSYMESGIKINRFYVKVHLISINPFNLSVIVSDNPIPDNWWQT